MELHFNPFLVEKESLRLGQVMEMLNKQSGVLGISGLSSDFRDLIAASEEGNDRARLAIDLFVYSVAKGIGSLVPALGGLEVLVFTAGIGENSPQIREKICSYLEYLGIALDCEKNLVCGKEVFISQPYSAVKALVISTDEECMIAQEAWDTVRATYAIE